MLSVKLESAASDSRCDSPAGNVPGNQVCATRGGFFSPT